MTSQQQTSDNQIHIFLFVNPKSGSRQGKKILDLGFKQVTFELSDHKSVSGGNKDEWRRGLSGDLSNHNVSMNIVDVTDINMKETALAEIKALQSAY